MNLYDMEDNARLENLAAFKRAYSGAVQALARCVGRSFPVMREEQVQRFLYAFLPFMFGLYPYTSATNKQREAMRLAGVSHPALSISQLVRGFAEKLLGAQ